MEEEILTFIGLTMAMGTVKPPEIRDYWKSKGIFYMPWFTSFMLRDHFEEIYQSLYLADNERQARRDPSNFYKLYKLGILPHKLSS